MTPFTGALTIFEGPDGSGKTTAAKAFAADTNAVYVHFGPLPQVSSGLARMYVEAMLPALLGYQDVVFDRSWLSEVPYGIAFREGADRLGDASRRMLERLALRCGAVVVRCDPGWETVLENYRRRKGQEMLRSEDQLRQVYDLYQQEVTDLPESVYDYRQSSFLGPFHDLVVSSATIAPCHLLASRTVGSTEARILLVGEPQPERKNDDPFYQWPFASFSKQGYSQWLTQHLEQAEISELDLLWANADEPTLKELVHRERTVIAIGEAARVACARAGVSHLTVPHPQHYMRFRQAQTYPLAALILEHTS